MIVIPSGGLTSAYDIIVRVIPEFALYPLVDLEGHLVTLLHAAHGTVGSLICLPVHYTPSIILT